MILSMGTKRVLDEAVLSSDEHAQHSDPIDMFHPPPVSVTLLTVMTHGAAKGEVWGTNVYG